MRTPLLLLAAAGLALACLAPTAQAQMAGPQYSIVVSLAPPTDALSAEKTKVEFAGKVTYTGDPTSMLNLHGVPVQYKITQAPAWAAVTVSPGSDVIPLTTQGVTSTGSVGFLVTVYADANAVPASEVGVIEITATVMPSAPMTPAKSAPGQAPVQFYVPHEDDCDEHAPAAALFVEATEEPAAAPREESGDDLHVQTAGVAPAGTWYAVGGFALVGAGVGLMLRRRFKA